MWWAGLGALWLHSGGGLVQLWRGTWAAQQMPDGRAHQPPQHPPCPPSRRGALAVQVDLTTAKVDVHSGMAGGAVQNPARALAQLLATMWHPNNSVAIAGFYDNVRPITDADRWAGVLRAGWTAAGAGHLAAMDGLGRPGQEQQTCSQEELHPPSHCPLTHLPSSPTAREDMEAYGFDEEGELLRPLGAAQPVGEAGYTSLERLWHRPTLEVGLRAGWR